MSEEDKQSMPPPPPLWTPTTATSQSQVGSGESQPLERSQSVHSQSQSPNPSTKRPRIEVEEIEPFTSSASSSTIPTPLVQSQSQSQSSTFGSPLTATASRAAYCQPGHVVEDQNINRARYPHHQPPYPRPAAHPQYPSPLPPPQPFPSHMAYPPFSYESEHPFSMPSGPSLKYGPGPITPSTSSLSRPPTPITPHAPGGFPNPILISSQEFHPLPGLSPSPSTSTSGGISYGTYPQHYVHHSVPTYGPPSVQPQGSGSLTTTSILRPPSTTPSSSNSPSAHGQPSPSPPLRAVGPVPSSSSSSSTLGFPQSSQVQGDDLASLEDQVKPSKPKGKHKGIPGPKARIPVEAKIAIAEHIISKGVAMANLDELAQMTGLTKQQIKSQLVDNRQNIRRQLSEFARNLQ
ncbi:hypothetical protein I302_100648 [Kwoniella bestiolae CBS 10118]|uniref:Uncharacterized protein n=1 Tax=Kwoniella bestiolae CBS 10118 TaxID=1296100 RepID=A0A1B9G5Q5_9TREE|nr:hypothetical protein I302_04023 [Kwoniella bestiolae CBS 10118]OCF26340.1 hypothetical protein I302_04023 [Kwoniella bestiolae CBS 10118]